MTYKYDNPHKGRESDEGPMLFLILITLLIIASALMYLAYDRYQAREEEKQALRYLQKANQQLDKEIKEIFNAPKITGETKKAIPLEKIQYKYPVTERRSGHEGTVRLRVELNDYISKPISVKLARTSGYEAFDTEAIKKTEQALFEPSIKDGQAINSIYELNVIFSLVN